MISKHQLWKYLLKHRWLLAACFNLQSVPLSSQRRNAGLFLLAWGGAVRLPCQSVIMPGLTHKHTHAATCKHVSTMAPSSLLQQDLAHSESKKLLQKWRYGIIEIEIKITTTLLQFMDDVVLNYCIFRPHHWHTLSQRCVEMTITSVVSISVALEINETTRWKRTGARICVAILKVI